MADKENGPKMRNERKVHRIEVGVVDLLEDGIRIRPNEVYKVVVKRKPFVFSK